MATVAPRLLGWLALLILAVGQAQTTNGTPDFLKIGVEAFHQAHYVAATQDFRQAVTADPQSVTAHLYLAMSLYSQFVPGRDSPEQLQFADQARAEFLAVLNLDPSNVTATSSLASLYYNQKKFDDAEEWNKKVIALDASHKEAYYTLGVIAWTRFLPVDRQARTDSNQRAEDPGPISDAGLRQQLKSTWLPALDDGVSNMQKALQLDPQYDDAMAYLNLLIRYRGDLLDTREEWKAASDEADGWMQKALVTKRAKSEQAPALSAGSAPPTTVPAPTLPAPTLAGGDHSLRIGENVMSANLTNRVDPVYPPLALAARISGTVVFRVKVGADGSVQNLALVSGHPLLVSAAREAVQKYVYQPTLLNGQPVEVSTTVKVPFLLP